MEINFSFIIPHRNSPDLLKRCVDSIPIREDIEIIVVDDNSEPSNRPDLSRPDVKVILLSKKDSNGAGHARNVGKNNAIGRWVLFIDCDDTYTENLVPFMEKYNDSDASVVYFNYNRVKRDIVERNICRCLKDSTDDAVFDTKYLNTMPWNKMVKRNFISENNIVFEETPVGNDIFYTYQVGYFAKDNFVLEDKALYNYYINGGSIIHRRRGDEMYYLTILKHIYQCNAFYTFLGRKNKSKNIFVKFVAILKKRGIVQMFFAIQVFINHYSEIRNSRNYFVENVDKK